MAGYQKQPRHSKIETMHVNKMIGPQEVEEDQSGLSLFENAERPNRDVSLVDVSISLSTVEHDNPAPAQFEAVSNLETVFMPILGVTLVLLVTTIPK